MRFSFGEFWDNLFKLLVTGDKNENALVSPLSLHVALSMVLHGARNNSESQLKSALRLPPDANVKQVGNYYNSLLNRLQERNYWDTVHISNHTLISKFYGLRTKYANTLLSKYKSKSDQVDFKSDGHNIVQQMNQWVNESTKGLIRSFVEEPFDADTALVLLNCIYFKGQWKQTFDTLYIRRFHLSSIECKDVPFMSVRDSFKYLEVPFESSGGQVKMVEIPYKGSCSMIVLFPSQSITVNKVITEIPLFDILMQFIKNGKYTNISLHLPKFTFKSNCQMSEILKKMGAVDIFDEKNADLTGISKVKSVQLDSTCLYISKVKQSSVIEVHEEGTEAAVSTIPTVEGTFEIALFLLSFLIISCIFALLYLEMLSLNIDFSQPLDLVLESPFVFFIFDTFCHVPIFMGKLQDPSK